MDTEFEAKFYPIDKDKFRVLLKKLGARLIIPERKMRRVIIDGRLHPEFQCHYVRVRDEGNMIRLSAKIHATQDGNVSDQKEVDVEVSDFDKTIEIFKAMNLAPDKYQETTRETWAMENTEITIDTWPGLSPYCEIEAKSEESVKMIAEKLGFDWNRKILTSIVEVYGRIYGLTNDQVHEKLANISFEYNPFADLSPVVSLELQP